MEEKNMEEINKRFSEFLLEMADEIYEEKKAAYGDKLIGASIYLSSQGGVSTEAWDYTKGADGAECVFREYYTKEFLETHNLLELIEDAKSEMDGHIDDLRKYLNETEINDISAEHIQALADQIHSCKCDINEWQESLEEVRKKLNG